LEPAHHSLSLLYEDEWIVAVNKPAGQLVHPAEVPAEGDLVTMKLLRDQIGQQVYVIHRLDRPTSGVLLFATDQEAARTMHAAFENREVEKVYWAVVDGMPAAEQWTCQEPIRKGDDQKERAAETTFEVLEVLAGNMALVEARPKTGRFHQIRRHLLHAGTPIIGDYRYAGIERCVQLGATLGTGTRMLLQARSLQFQHPQSGSGLLIEAPVDPLIQQLRNQSSGG